MQVNRERITYDILLNSPFPIGFTKIQSVALMNLHPSSIIPFQSRGYKIDDEKIPKIYGVTFQMIEGSALKSHNLLIENLPHSLFKLRDVVTKKNELEIKIDHDSQEDPCIIAFWSGSLIDGCSKDSPKILPVYLTGGKIDPPKVINRPPFTHCVYHQPVQAFIQLNLKIFAQKIKEQNKKFDEEADVVFKVVCPGKRLMYRDKDREYSSETKKSTSEIARIKLSEFVPLAL